MPAPVDTSAVVALPTSRARRACINCAKVKERCVPLEPVDSLTSTTCQRCNRLRKDCITPDPAPRKRQRTKSGHIEPWPSPSPSYSVTAAPCPLEAPGRSSASVISSVIQAPIATVSSTLAALDDTKKVDLFDNFLKELNPYFPFLVLEDHCKTAASCQEHAPFTFAACIAAALHRHPNLQKRISREILSTVCETMFMAGKKSLDLLQGISLLISWYSYHTQRMPQLMNLVHLVMALLVDLGLTKAPGSVPLAITCSDIPRLIHGFDPLDSENNRLPGYRALLASYYTSAQLSISLRRLDYPRWSSHMEDCCQKLEAASASPLDVYSTCFVRVYQMAERYLGVDGIRPSKDLPIRAYVRCFREDVQRIRSSLPPCIAANPQYEILLQGIEIALYDNVTTTTSIQSTQLLEALHALLARVNSFFDSFLSQPTEQFPLFTFLHMTYPSHATDVLSKLSFIQYEGWDLSHVRTNHSFVAIVERIIDKFEEVFHSERGRFPDLDNSRFAIYSMKLRQYKKWYEDRIATETKEALEHARTTNAADATDMPDLGFSQYPDDFVEGWWPMVDGDFQVS